MKENNFVKEVPSGYVQVKYINAKNVKVGLIFNAICLLVAAAVITVAVLLAVNSGENIAEANPIKTLIVTIIGIAVFFAYIILHELVHGVAYKQQTGEKLTFGLSWSCAYCGVPNVYVYRKTAIIAVAAPLIIFSIIFMATSAVAFFLDKTFFLLSAAILGFHLGGCSGDIYVLALLIFKFKNKKTLMRDTGPEQYFYLPKEN